MAGQPKPAAPIEAPGLVRDLVHQFDQPLHFLRELVQNSIDASSNRILVSVEHLSDGTVVTAVEDDGEGMDENIIDNYLLVLFRSSKENDLTKIGKFGIGFMSVFAMKPELVRVYTGKSGQSWRVDFPDYRRWLKYRLEEPREGTRVELRKKMTAAQFQKFAADARETVLYWCKHSESRIDFEVKGSGRPPESLVRPFGLDEGVAIRHEEEGTEVLLGFTAEPAPFFGFYNRGLTLKEGKEAFVPGVAFKIKSRWLEHTLTRDDVMQDDNYGKAMRLLHRLADEPLEARLREELEAWAREASQGGPALDASARFWNARRPRLQHAFGRFLGLWKRSDWPIFPTLSGAPVGFSAARDEFRRHGCLLFDAERNPLTEALQSRGRTVFLQGPWLEDLCSWRPYWSAKPAEGDGTQRVHSVSRTYFKPEIVDDGELEAPVRALLATARSVDARTGCKYAGIQGARLDQPYSCVKGRLFVIQTEPGALSVLGERPPSSLFFRRKRWALLNLAHSSLERLARLHATRPGLAAFLLLKMLHLHDGPVPAGQTIEHSNLALKMEARLLQSALALDVPAREGA